MITSFAAFVIYAPNERNVEEVNAKVPYYLTYLYSYRIHSDSKFKTDRGKPYYNP